MKLMTPKEIAASLKFDRRVSQGPNGSVYCDGFLSNIDRVREVITQVEPNVGLFSERVQELLIGQVLRHLNLGSNVNSASIKSPVGETIKLVDLDGRVAVDSHNRPVMDDQAQLWPTRSAA